MALTRQCLARHCKSGHSERKINFKLSSSHYLQNEYITMINDKIFHLGQSYRKFKGNPKLKDSRFIQAPFKYKILPIFLVLLLLKGKGKYCYELKKKTQNTQKSNSVPRYIPKRSENRYLNRYLCINVHSSSSLVAKS